MPDVRMHISISLDGFVAGPNQSEQDPIGEGGMQLHQWVFGLEAWRKEHGMEGGEVNASSEVVERAQENVGAVVMGRNMFGGGPGPWGDDPRWDGWWGDDPPYHVPVYVLTHYAREPLEMQGGTTFHFVTDGIESAVAQAREAAGERNVSLAGGASVAQQCMRAGLLDELQLHVAPVLLGDGERLFDGVSSADVELEGTDVVDAPGVTHLTYRVASPNRASAS
jgi:dihydrofolate reductase